MVKLGAKLGSHKLGSHAGIDHSNVDQDPENDWVLLLPENPDESASSLQNEFLSKTGCKIGVIINDSIGRAWRNGTIGTAIGVAGLSSIVDLRGRADLFGNQLRVSEEAIADELASAAGLIMGQGNEQKPVIIIKGFNKQNSSEFDASNLVVTEENDLYR